MEGADEPASCSPCRLRLWARGLVSLPALIVLWCGVWLWGDTCLPRGDADWRKECAMVALGMILMLATDMFYTSAYMERCHGGLSITEQGRALRESADPGTCAYAAFYSKCVVGMVGTIFFWNGVFNLVDMAAQEVSFQVAAQLGAALLGSAVVLCVIQIEDVARAHERRDRGHDQDIDYDGVTEKPACGAVLCFVGALVCNASQVLLWWGVETLTEEHLPDHAWAAGCLFMGGVLTLQLLDRLEANLGIQEKDSSTEEKSPAMQSTLAKCIINAAELFSVVIIWTGCEWFIWDDFLFRDTCARDALYAVSGTAVLAATGMFAALAGAVSPMGLYGRVHHTMQHDDSEGGLLMMSLDSPSCPRFDSTLWESEWSFERSYRYYHCDLEAPLA